MPNLHSPRVLTTILWQSGAPADVTAPTLTISTVSVTGNVAAMQIVASEEVSGFAVGDITISAGGSLASFATADNITFTVSWTLAAGANTMDIAANVCQDIAGNNNTVAAQYGLTNLTIQPGSPAGIDAFIYSSLPTDNFGTDSRIQAGGYLGSVDVSRFFIKFDLSTIPAGSAVYSSVLSLYLLHEYSGNERTARVFRMKRAWVESQVTWNIYSTGNNWETAGGFGANDCEQTDIGNLALSATETINTYKNFTLTASKIQEMITSGAFTNNGFLIKMDTENNDAYEFVASDAGSNLPKLVVVYRP